MHRLSTFCLLMGLALPGCDAALRDLYGNFTRANPEDCVLHTDLCASLEPIGGVRPYCDPNLRRCVADGLCLPGQKFCMSASLPLCEASTNRCLPCQSDSQCSERSANEPLCQAGRCVECRDASQCLQAGSSGPYCDTTSHRCRGCLRDDECSDSRACRTDLAPLQPGTPELGYACASVSDVALVDHGPSGAGPCSPTGPGTPGALPFCEIVQALAAGRVVIKLGASAQPYSAVTIDAGQFQGGHVLITGAGRDVGAHSASLLCGLAISGGSVSVSGIWLDPGVSNVAGPCDPTGRGLPTVCAAGGTGACCIGGSLSIHTSRIQNGTSGVVSYSGCRALEITQSRFDSVRGNCVVLADGATSYRITNSALHYCGRQGIPASYAVVLGKNTQGLFAFNTISESAAAVRCSDRQSQAIRYSLYYQTGAVEVDDGCSVLPRVSDIQLLAPDYIKLDGASAKLGNAVDKVTLTPPLSTDPALLVDYFGTARPVGTGHDYGCHELVRE